jgi:hypothetical protein
MRGIGAAATLCSRAPYRDIIIGKGFRNVNVGGRPEQAYLLYVVDTPGVITLS